MWHVRGELMKQKRESQTFEQECGAFGEGQRKAIYCVGEPNNQCRAASPTEGWGCSRERNHKGMHEAHDGGSGLAFARWKRRSHPTPAQEPSQRAGHDD